MNAAAPALHVALVGNPNCGKTALFNRLTGGRQKVANYAGVTVERKEGRFETPAGRSVRLLDLPGAYSLDAASPDEVITRDICAGRYAGEAPPDLIVCVLDATNLRLHLRFALELKRLGRPMLIALNMMDVAKKRGIRIDIGKLQAALGAPVVETVAVRHGGAAELLAQLDGAAPSASAAGTSGGEGIDLGADAGQALHAQVRALLADESAYEIVEFQDTHAAPADYATAGLSPAAATY